MTTILRYVRDLVVRELGLATMDDINMMADAGVIAGQELRREIRDVRARVDEFVLRPEEANDGR